MDSDFSLNCPAPLENFSSVKLGHGSGGRLTEQLIEQAFMPFLKNEQLIQREDAAVLPINNARFAFTTDSYVVSPFIFPGGDIGSLSVHGTVNDLCMRGARPLYLSAAFIMEEGLERKHLDTVVKSMQEACVQSGIMLVAADTKVVNKGSADKLFITTSGVGEIYLDFIPSVSSAQEDDVIICSGDIGRHGMAIMAVRESIEFDTTITSDSAPLNIMVEKLCEMGTSLHAMRDITRGGLAGVLNEIAQASSLGVALEESSIQIDRRVRAACEVLGLDPLYVACEGRLVAVVKESAAQSALGLMQKSPHGERAAIIGRIVKEHPGRVSMKSLIGGRRIVDKLSGDQLPRIC